MEIHTSLNQDEVLNHLRHGRMAAFVTGPLTQTPNGRWGGTWQHGVFSVRELDNEDREEQKIRFNLPPTLKTRIWLTTDQVYEGQTVVYQMVATAFKEWEGDLAVLNNGDYLRVERVHGNIRLREDCLGPDRLGFFQDFDWKPLPEVKD